MPHVTIPYLIKQSSNFLYINHYSRRLSLLVELNIIVSNRGARDRRKNAAGIVLFFSRTWNFTFASQLDYTCYVGLLLFHIEYFRV